jgi:hypothetical protein
VAARTDLLREQVRALTGENAALRGRVSELEARLQRIEALLATPQP